jgi:uncharacterized protein YcbK (DUF882 family)
VLRSGLNAARRRFTRPIYITSGFRCKRHNQYVGGSVASSHLRGLAADIACDNSRDRFELIKALIEAGFKRIGVRKDFIHVDVDYPEKPSRLLWLY